MYWFFDCVVGIVVYVVDVGDCVVGCVGNVGLFGFGVFEIVVWIVEFIVEEGYWVVVVCIEVGGLYGVVFFY